jgi:choline dehydrogenase-like flavoprotein
MSSEGNPAGAAAAAEPASALHGEALEEHQQAMVAVGEFTDMTEAQIARGLLDVNQIPSLVVDGLSAVMPTTIEGNVRLLVFAAHEDAARSLLSDPIAAEEMNWNEQDW